MGRAVFRLIFHLILKTMKKRGAVSYTHLDFVRKHSDHGGADVVLEVAGTEDTFRLAWECALSLIHI